MNRNAPGKVIVFGLMFDLPFPGIIAQFLHYLVGLRRLGWDVWYVEDSLSWPYDPASRSSAGEPRDAVRRVARVLERHGFGDRWVYRCAIPCVTTLGAGERTLTGLYRTADLALNVTGAQEIRDEHAAISNLVYVQSDPFALQVDVAHGDEWAAEQVRRHGAHFTFGELVGTPQCDLPTCGVKWQPTRQPVDLDLWSPGLGGNRFTTVTTWRAGGDEARHDTKRRSWKGEDYYWTKDREFLALVDLPSHTSALLELAVDGRPPEARLLERMGWQIVDGSELGVEFGSYRQYIRSSRGEFTVARDQYVRPRTGWFSDRSACYLAAGRPVVTQDTGFGEVLPTGEGLFAFSGVDDAAAALEAIESAPEVHGRAAREIAAEHFAAERVLAELIARVPLG